MRVAALIEVDIALTGEAKKNAERKPRNRQ
jgi:hypothetical protein